MLWLTEDAIISCFDGGYVNNLQPSQSWVTVSGRRVLIAPDPVGRNIVKCPNLPPMSKPCTTTLGVAIGYSGLIQISGQPLCMDNLKGPVDAPSGPFSVTTPGQAFVSAGS
jgi:hypothetical protein